MLGKLKVFLVVVATLGFESLNMSIMTWGLKNSWNLWTKYVQDNVVNLEQLKWNIYVGWNGT